MKKLSINISVLVFLFMFLSIICNHDSTLFCQSNNLKFDHLSIKDGLPSDGLKCVLQDHLGFIWIATANGLSKYDGYDFVNYYFDENDSNSAIRSNIVNIDDVDAIMAGLTDDHITMAPNEPALADMVKLRNHHEERIENYTSNFSFIIDEIEMFGDWAFVRFSSAVTVTPRSGDVSMNGKSKGIWIWKRQTDGIWKLARSIWNSDLPLPDSK